MSVKLIQTELGNFKEIRKFIFDRFKETGIPKKTGVEAFFVFETVYSDILENGVDPDCPVTVAVGKTFGETVVRIKYEGEIYVPLSGNEETTEDVIMGAYADKIKHSYFNGYNNIYISVKRSYSPQLIQGLIASLIACIVYIIMRITMDKEIMVGLNDNIFFPLEKTFANAVLMVGAPVTFFSLLQHMFSIYINSDSSKLRRIQKNAIFSSVTAILFAIPVGVLLSIPISNALLEVWGVRNITLKVDLVGLIESLVPTSIFSPFETIAPFPLLVLSLLTAYALCTSGEYFAKLKTAIDAGYTLFGRMLIVVMYTLPLFSFLATLDMLIDAGIKLTIGLGAMLLAIIISSIVIIALYMYRLAKSGVDVKMFAKKIPPLLLENLKINSAIDACPYNIRYCAHEYGMDKDNLKDALPLLAQINLDGNCYFITLTSLTIMFVSGTKVELFQVLTIGLLVLMLSLGAPNQPGSCVIGLLIIFNYMNQYEFIPVAIFGELILGSVQNLFNVFGDIVTVAVVDQNIKKEKKSKQKAAVSA